MNKYQEALFRIRLVLRTNHDEKWLYNELNLLHKLVEKETPMKPIGDYGIGHFCPNCKEPTIMFGGYTKVDKFLNRCENCGQRIDWGKHE